uniref:Uncharacterized protein n=1 Tax=Aegilops tauschii subsp. strangulata TaxID=200361 RepID=A0A453QVA2_AEGTS
MATTICPGSGGSFLISPTGLSMSSAGSARSAWNSWRRADVLEYYDQTVSSPSGSFYIPAVLRVPQLLQVVKRRRVKHCLSRKNILFRDGFSCQ